MVRRCLKSFALALAISFWASAVAAASATKSNVAAEQAWRAAAVRAIAAKSDANSLTTAAVLSFYYSSVQSRMTGTPPAPLPTALQLIAEAALLAPENAAVIWVHLQLCAATPGCDTRDIATVLRWVDPDNSAAWLSALTSAQRDRDSVEIDRLLADMARGTRFDLYYNPIMVLMFDSLSAVRKELPKDMAGSDAARLATLAAIYAAELIPSFSPLANICRESAAGSERREDCLKVAKIMQRGDAIIVQLIGFGMEKHLLPADSKEAHSLIERRQLLEWRLSAASKLDYSGLPWTLNARTRMRIAEMRLRPREEDVCIALLRDYKMALEPPQNP
jgi:hypothetical protein